MNIITGTKKLWERYSSLMETPALGQAPSAFSNVAQSAMEAADEEIKYGYDVELKATKCMAAMHAVNAEIQLIQRQRAHASEAFSREYAAFARERVAPMTPREIPEHATKVTRYTRGWIAAIALEITLATMVLTAMGVNLIVAFISSSALTLVLLYAAHSVITEITDRPSPRHTHDLIKARILRPAIALTVPAIGVVLLARVMSDLSDWLLPIFLPILQIAMWVATLGLILLGGALYALADLYRWSQSHARKFDQLDRRQAELENKRAYYRSHLPKGPHSDQPQGSDTGKGKPSHLRVASQVMMLLLAVGVSLLSGCSEVKPKEVRAEARASATPLPATLHIQSDVSGSLATPGGELAVQNLYAQLPAITDAINATGMRITYFATEGWMVPQAMQLNWLLPEQPDLKIKERKAGEASIFGGVYASVEKANQRELEASRQELARRQAEAKSQALASLSPAVLSPQGVPPAPCTNLNSVLTRISVAPRRAQRQVYLILTDGYQTCGPLSAIPPPQDNVQTFILLAPAHASEAAGKAPAAQFLNRQAALQQAAPWAKVVSVYEADLAELLGTPPTQTTTTDKLAIQH